jgi:hypothetical protein
MDITYIDPLTGIRRFAKIIADAFARQGIQLANEDFSRGGPLHHAVMCAAGHHSKVTDGISRRKLSKFTETVAGLRATLADWRREYESQGKAIPADTRGGLRSEPHLDFLHSQIGFDLSGHIGAGWPPGLNNLIAVLDAAEAASARLLADSAPPPANRPPNGPYNAFFEALHAGFVRKTGRKGIDVDGERSGPFVQILAEVETHLPFHMRPDGFSTGARAGRKRANSRKGRT